ncbi:4-hydroxyphenylacetate catabolism regulatory protein HpaA [Marinospirillum alkaliphilum]|uniref:AraC family transcriptional regulator, 4-hydroxyphenylacetate 3-monooxygenase operon regulatory protein n=1 Tax=Marinospirillum alkaliphilum DSM 21637 TaxID=1122209 RepID=A0A1K1V0V5_9GAMM|nr:4-hydroxyphenylacetate catabolism regulatory protein HpaA [Marinospirillum alkaliphilum]SFX18712.1 AraC family transcriptional regulator, 4-hydroxyphenylacetate 3-monooxygenase operon regulatory protein [Marinospirillum alkaliphilum DSM 21637]
MSDASHSEWIPNIILGQDYDRRYLDAPIHYDVLENLAVFFGRDMPVHRHAQYLQIHYIDRGELRFHIDDKIYQAQGPALVLTPPSVPHSFLTCVDACGHVLTLHQSLIWQLLKEGLKQELEQQLNRALCITADGLGEKESVYWKTVVQTLEAIRNEWSHVYPAKDLALQTLVRLLLIQISRLSAREAVSTSVNNDDLRAFRQFSSLIQEHYRDHWQLRDYTSSLGLSESRLHQICQRIANRSPKKIIHDHLVQEAKRLLTFSNLASSDICYQLGFSDPAYFSRFFKRHTGLTAQQFRQQQH